MLSNGAPQEILSYTMYICTITDIRPGLRGFARIFWLAGPCDVVVNHY